MFIVSVRVGGCLRGIHKVCVCVSVSVLLRRAYVLMNVLSGLPPLNINLLPTSAQQLRDSVCKLYADHNTHLFSTGTFSLYFNIQVDLFDRYELLEWIEFPIIQMEQTAYPYEFA